MTYTYDALNRLATATDNQAAAHGGPTAPTQYSYDPAGNLSGYPYSPRCNPGLKPSEIKAILRRTSRDVLQGSSNPASDDNGVAQQAGPGDDGATGAGFVDAFTAFQQA